LGAHCQVICSETKLEINASDMHTFKSSAHSRILCRLQSFAEYIGNLHIRPTHTTQYSLRRVRRSFQGEKTLERSHCDIPGSDFDARTKATNALPLSLSHVGAIIIASYTKWNSSASSLVIKAPNSHVRAANSPLVLLSRAQSYVPAKQSKAWMAVKFRVNLLLE
jgi:hypothetical protein